MSPPSACTAGRIRLITPCTRSRTDCCDGGWVAAGGIGNVSRQTLWHCDLPRPIIRPIAPRTKRSLTASDACSGQEMKLLVPGQVIDATVHRLPGDDAGRLLNRLAEGELAALATRGQSRAAVGVDLELRRFRLPRLAGRLRLVNDNQVLAP